MPTNPSPLNPRTVADSVDAMRDVQTETDRWRLGDTLHTAVPEGVEGFGQISDAAKAGKVPALSINSMRLYRDTAKRWPQAKRLPELSFSAHREAMVLGDIDDARTLLKGLAANTPPGKAVTVTAVRRAIASQSGAKVKPQVSPAEKAMAEVLKDLANNGGAKLVAAIPASTDGKLLDQYHSGLNRVIHHVEQLRVKKAAAAAKAAAAKKQAPVADGKGVKPAPAKATAKRGDLRGL